MLEKVQGSITGPIYSQGWEKGNGSTVKGRGSRTYKWSYEGYAWGRERRKGDDDEGKISSTL